MQKKRMSIIVLLVFIVAILGYNIFNEESMGRRIILGNFYESSTKKASEVLEFSINPKDYIWYKGDKLGERRLLMEKYDTKVYLEPILNQEDHLWINWTFENNWWKKSGTCFTYTDIRFEDGKRIYSNANPKFEAVDQDGNRVNDGWGGGGSTYTFGFHIEKQIFENCESINVKLSDFNIVNYRISLTNTKENISHPKSTEILYKEEIENGTIVLYKDKSGFRHAFISDKLKIINRSVNGELNPKDGFDCTMNNDPNIPIVTFAGVITNDEITDVLVKQKTVEKKAKIIELDKDLIIWFTYFDILERPDPGKPDPLRIEALSSSGEVLWKHGVYEDGLFHGPTTEK